MQKACTYHPHNQTYSCDPKLSTAFLKEAVKHLLENAIADSNEYLNRRVVPLHEAYPFSTAIFATVLACWATWRYRRFLVKMGLLVVMVAAVHAWAGGRAGDRA